MADVITSADPYTLGLLELAHLIETGADESTWNAAKADIEAKLGVFYEIGLDYASMTDAGSPPQTTVFGSNAVAFQTWVASLF